MRWFTRFKPIGVLYVAVISMALTHGELTAAKCPCDIYDAAGTPCVAAHSTVRALYADYNGPLYQVRRLPDTANKKDIYPLTPGGIANTAVQDSFLGSKAGTISLIYDQSKQGNHLPVSPVAYWLKKGGTESSATKGKIAVNGHTVYGIYVTGNADDVAYRNNKTKGIATGDQAESMYMVLDAKRYSSNCCFDYGNAETNGLAGAKATMEAIYWGSDVQWGGPGGGSGPWVAADLEDGMYKGNTKNTPGNTSITGMAYATTMLKGPSGNHFTLKAGNAQSGKLQVKWDGTRPSGFSPKLLEGAIIIGCGGDGSDGGTGTFFEGAMTFGTPPDSVDDAVQANIVAAGYGRTATIIQSHPVQVAAVPMVNVDFSRSRGNAVIDYVLPDARRVNVDIVDERGRRIAAIALGVMSAGRHAAVWNAKPVPAGVYIWRVVIDGREEAAGRLIVGK